MSVLSGKYPITTKVEPVSRKYLRMTYAFVAAMGTTAIANEKKTVWLPGKVRARTQRFPSRLTGHAQPPFAGRAQQLADDFGPHVLHARGPEPSSKALANDAQADRSACFWTYFFPFTCKSGQGEVVGTDTKPARAAREYLRKRLAVRTWLRERLPVR
jgi:hypothetical protein